MAIVTDPEVVKKQCQGTNGYTTLDSTEYSEVINEKGGDTADAKVSDAIKSYETSIAGKDGAYDEACGVTNAISQSLEKGACSADKKYITEITEVIGGEVSTEDGQVLDVYKGICCLAGNSGSGACVETRSFYAEDYTNCNNYAAHCEKRQWIIASTGAGIIKTYVKQIYIFAASIIGFISVCVIIFSGIQISISGVSGSIEEAKERIIQSIMGLVLLFLSGLILYTINPTFFS